LKPHPKEQSPQFDGSTDRSTDLTPKARTEVIAERLSIADLSGTVRL
jgi:hypothetical protein